MSRFRHIRTLAMSCLAIATCAAVPGKAAPAGEPDQNDPVAMRALERDGAMPLDAFFNADTRPRHDGDLIRKAVASGYDIPADWQATRILYRSRDIQGRPSTASAVVLLPPGKAPDGGWPLVVWAHGTTGVARQCGPSATKSLGYYTQALAGHGFAVLVIDYAGLSTGGAPHQYMTKVTNALDVVNAVPAAHSAVKGLSRSWVAIGHSQGGQTIWGVAELEAKRKDAGYLGSIALAPAVGGDDLVRRSGAQRGQMFYTVYMAHTIKVQSPGFKLSTMLKPKALATVGALTRDGCYMLAAATFSGFEPGTALQPGWDRQEAVRRFFARNRVGTNPIGGPLFVASGTVDTAVPPDLVEKAARGQCKTGGGVFYKSYPGDHGTMMQSSYDDQLAWIKDRFAGKPATTNCQ